MSKSIIAARTYAEKLGIKVVLGDVCAYYSIHHKIEICPAELRKYSEATRVPLELTTLYVLLHEIGHAEQDTSLQMLALFNPIPAEEDAWDRAIGLYYNLFGVDAPIEMYKLRRHCLKTYYDAYGHLVK